jgi:hypothetical protein
MLAQSRRTRLIGHGPNMVTLLVRGAPAAGRAGFEAAITISVTVPAAGPVAAFSRV